MKLIDDLIAASESSDTPDGLKLLLHEAALNIIQSSREITDNCRFDFLEDLGHFTIEKPDGEDFEMVVEMCQGVFFASVKPTLREAVDEVFRECRGEHHG